MNVLRFAVTLILLAAVFGRWWAAAFLATVVLLELVSWLARVGSELRAAEDALADYEEDLPRAVERPLTAEDPARAKGLGDRPVHFIDTSALRRRH